MGSKLISKKISDVCQRRNIFLETHFFSLRFRFWPFSRISELKKKQFFNCYSIFMRSPEWMILLWKFFSRLWFLRLSLLSPSRGSSVFFSRKNSDWKIFWINFNNLKFSNPLSFRQTLLYWVGLCYLYSYLQFLQFCPILEKWEKSKIFKRNRNFTQKYFIMNEDKRTWRNQGSKSLLGFFPGLKKLFIQNITLNFKINLYLPGQHDWRTCPSEQHWNLSVL